jgi:hypothetical protein
VLLPIAGVFSVEPGFLTSPASQRDRCHRGRAEGILGQWEDNSSSDVRCKLARAFDVYTPQLRKCDSYARVTYYGYNEAIGKRVAIACGAARLVVGSSPTAGANFTLSFAYLFVSESCWAGPIPTGVTISVTLSAHVNLGRAGSVVR